MTNSEIKKAFIDALYNRGGYIRQVDDVEYRLRCPICGDSETNMNKARFYIRIDPDDNFPMVYKCFKCQAKGVVDSELMNLLEIDDINLKSNIGYLNKTSDNIEGQKVSFKNDKIIMFDYVLPEVQRYPNKINYIRDRLGCDITQEDISNMKITTSLKDFLIVNKIKETTFEKSMCRLLESNYIGFLSFGSSYILFRDVSGKPTDMPWIKYPITKESKKSKIFYSIASDINIFTTDELTINLSEGVMDILSAYKNLGYNKPNTMNIAVGGQLYPTVLQVLIGIGIVGSNIHINIFSDNDGEFNNKENVHVTDIKYFNTIFKKIKYLYGSVTVHYNRISKDIGVPSDKIKLKSIKL